MTRSDRAGTERTAGAGSDVSAASSPVAGPGARDLEVRLADFIDQASWDGPSDEAGFDALALASFRYQVDAIPAYGAYARYLGLGPDAVRTWRDIPAVPASAYKSHDLSAAAPGAGFTFETSGTSISRPGRVRLASTRLYERSLLRSFARHLLPEGARLPAMVFGPSAAAAPRSSLWFMVDRAVAAHGEGATWAIEGAGADPRWAIVEAALTAAERSGQPVLLLGTTLLFAAFFERCRARGARFRLPAGSRVMDTGGEKGAHAEISRAEVEAALAATLGIPPDHLVNEYGMAELGSQFYDDRLLAGHQGRAARSGHGIPPWVRTRVLDPESMRERGSGEPGLLIHYDLANLEVPLAVQTEDLGARVGDRLLLAGRMAEAERRGCSLPFERFLEAARAGAGELPPTAGAR